jgi:hypothetical protein
VYKKTTIKKDQHVTKTTILTLSLIFAQATASVFIATPILLPDGTSLEAHEIRKHMVVASSTLHKSTTATVIHHELHPAPSAYVLWIGKTVLSVSCDQYLWDATCQDWILPHDIDISQTRLLTIDGHPIAVSRVLPIHGSEFPSFCSLSLEGSDMFYASDVGVLLLT